LLLVYFKRRSPGYLILATLASLSVLFTHPWTWDILVVMLGVYLVYTFVKGVGGWRKTLASDTLPLVALLGVNGAIELAKRYVLPLLSGGGVSDYSGSQALQGVISGGGIGLQNLAEVQLNLRIVSMIDFGGSYTNPLLLLLAAGGMLVAISRRNRFQELLLAWVLVVSGAVPLMDFIILARFVYVVPFQVLAALALSRIVNHPALIGESLSRRLVVVTPVLVFATYAVRSLANLVVYF
jgi:hypothetical protein